jgi:hypothetical protein
MEAMTWRFLVLGAGLVGEVVAASFALRFRRERAALEAREVTKISDLVDGPQMVRGKLIAPDEVLTSPMAQEPCVYYSLVVEFLKSVQAKKAQTRTWLPLLEEEKGLTCLVSDGSGVVEVDLSAATLELRGNTSSTGAYVSPRIVPAKARTGILERCDRLDLREVPEHAMQYREVRVEDGCEVQVWGKVDTLSGDRPRFKGGDEPVHVSDLTREEQRLEHDSKLAATIGVMIGIAVLVGAGIWYS